MSLVTDNTLSVLPTKELSIGNLLVGLGKISLEDVERVLHAQKDTNQAFGEVAKRLGLVTENDIQEILAHQFHYPYLQKPNKQFSHSLYAVYDPFSEKSEALRDLRSQLLLRWFNSGHQLLAITSMQVEDKASELVANLAVAFSQLGKKTLLIDANLRNPVQHTLFHLENRQGLSNRLIPRTGIHPPTENITQLDAFPGLSVLTAGTIAPNPLELIERTNFLALLETFSKLYEVILLDTSPFLIGSDALTVVSRSKGMLVVVKKDSSRLNTLGEFMETSKITGAEPLGFVMLEQ